MAKERLQKLLAQANVASRRASEDLIAAGRVRVNGEVAKLGDQADPATDTITVDGTRLNFENQQRVYIALNKPKQVLSTTKPHRTDTRQTVLELIGRNEHLFSVGRLDADSEGLVVMTNDGELAQRLTHPRYRHSKTYRVEVLGLPTAETLEKWQQGVFLEDGKTAPCFVEIVKGSVKGSTLRVVMTEGKKRQIRRVAGLLGHPVRRLTRTHIGMFAMGDLAPGQWREMTPKEVMALKSPAPEIKGLKAQPPRRITPQAAAETDETQLPAKRGRGTAKPDGTKRPSRGKPSQASSDSQATSWNDDSRDDKPSKRRNPNRSGDKPSGKPQRDSGKPRRSSIQKRRKDSR